jgi:hypothetical protein
MRQYETLTDALEDLRIRGFVLDFNLTESCLECTTASIRLHPEDFEVSEFYRFEGMNDPDDSSILYAIEGRNGAKGILVSAYGVYADSTSTELMKKLTIL